MKIYNSVFLFIFFNYHTVILGLTYENYTLFNLYLNERYKIKFLRNLEKIKYLNVIFWQRPFKMFSNIQVLVSPADIDLFKERLRHFSVDATVLSNDIQKLFDAQKITKYSRMRLDTYVWNYYHNLEDVYQWMSDLAKKHSKNVNLMTLGKSAEGREILALEVFPPTPKAKVIVEGGIHGCEWITTEFVTYLANELINLNSNYTNLKQVANKYHWILIPVLNPDGYVYSQSSDRLWQKNRRVIGNGSVGVDLNKNFDYSFCKFDGSNNSNSHVYCGPSPFSEPETSALRKTIDLNSKRLNYYFSIHAYGQKITIPYSDRINHIENFAEMENYGKQAILKMYRMSGVKYSIGTIYDVYGYRSSGDSVSWVKRKHKVKYAMTFHLRDNGTYGHALPSHKILTTCKETLAGLVEVMTVRHRHVRLDFNAASILKLDFVFKMILFITYI